MFNFNIPWETIGASQSLVLEMMAIYGLLWLLTLGLALTRIDLDPVTRLMWVIVLIFVPLCGVALYFILSPRRHLDRRPRQPRGPLDSDVSGTPWEQEPGHRLHE